MVPCKTADLPSHGVNSVVTPGMKIQLQHRQSFNKLRKYEDTVTTLEQMLQQVVQHPKLAAPPLLPGNEDDG
jgi:hypothetical protein